MGSTFLFTVIVILAWTTVSCQNFAIMWISGSPTTFADGHNTINLACYALAASSISWYNATSGVKRGIEAHAPICSFFLCTINLTITPSWYQNGNTLVCGAYYSTNHARDFEEVTLNIWSTPGIPEISLKPNTSIIDASRVQVTCSSFPPGNPPALYQIIKNGDIIPVVGNKPYIFNVTKKDDKHSMFCSARNNYTSGYLRSPSVTLNVYSAPSPPKDELLSSFNPVITGVVAGVFGLVLAVVIAVFVCRVWRKTKYQNLTKEPKRDRHRRSADGLRESEVDTNTGCNNDQDDNYHFNNDIEMQDCAPCGHSDSFSDVSDTPNESSEPEDLRTGNVCANSGDFNEQAPSVEHQRNAEGLIYVQVDLDTATERKPVVKEEYNIQYSQIDFEKSTATPPEDS